MTLLQMLYNSVILPYLGYSILTWGAKISRDDKLHLIQKRCVRTLSNSSYIAHTEPICRFTNNKFTRHVFCGYVEIPL